MKLLVTVAAAAAAATALAASAGAASGNETTRHDRNVIRFFQHHPELARTPAGVKALWQVMSHLEQVVRSLQAVRAAAAAWPAHRALWECIHGGEGDWDAATGNGYYGGLQMTPGWLGYFQGTANQYSAAQQEQFAEQGYRDSGYSSAWLSGQWPNTSGPCMQYA